MKKSHLIFKPIVLACSLAIAACGSGGDSTPGPVSSTTLSGTAAAGAAIIGTVTVKGAMGNTKSERIEADGTYNVDVSGLTAPYRLRAQGTVGGKTYKLHSYAEEADVGGNVNITPFTDLIIANVAQTIAENYFDDDVLDTTEVLDSADIETQEAALQEKLQDIFDVLGLGTAIDLLNDTFSADHSGLDAALDLISIEVDSNTNTATITNLVDNSTIQDVVTVGDDNTEAFVIDPADEATYSEAVTDTQAIANLFGSFAANFAGGLPTQAEIEDFFANGFLLGDNSKGEFLTDITTDPTIIDLGFTGVSISSLDSTAGTATVTFNVTFNDEIDSETETWFVAKDATLGWQLLGDQRIVDLNTLNFHCNDYDGTDNQPGGCGINTQFWDEDETNNGTSGTFITSGSVSIIDGTDGVTVKDTFYLGTPNYVAPGDVQIYNESTDINVAGNFSGDWRSFGNAVNEIAASTFVAGDIVEYKLFTADLDVTDPTAPAVTGTAVATYTSNILFAPSTTGLYPTATSATLTAMDSFELGNSLTLAWTLASGTVSDEVLLEVSDNQGNRIEIWDESFSSSTTSITIASSELDAAAATAAGLDSQATSYDVLVRIYATDEITGQEHSTDYSGTIPGPAATIGGGTTPPVTSLTCGFETPWDDINEEPSSFNSYTEFEEVVTACGGAIAMTDSDVIGTWQDTWTDSTGAVYVETIVYDATGGTGTFTETEDGVVIETVPFTWSVANNLMTLTASIQTVSIMEIWALTGVNSFTVYTEESSWSSAPDLSTLDGTAEGEIWTNSPVKQ